MPGSLEPLDLVVQIPYHFRCPISLELMRDPVTVCTGQTYDRSSIEPWVATGNTTCPVTRASLTDFSLIPNHTLRRLIQDWCVANRSFGVERIPTPKQPADPNLVRTLLNHASSGSGSFASRLSALRRMRTLACESDMNRSVMVANDTRGVMLSILFADVGSGATDLSLESLAVLSMLPLSEPECLYVVSDPNRIGYLVNLLFHSSIDVNVAAAAVIEVVAAGTRSLELRALVSGADGVFEGVVGILKSPLASPRALKAGMKALFALCLVKQHLEKAVEAGAAEALVNRMAEFEGCDAERALATAELLCRIATGCAALASHALTAPLLVKAILKISERATEYALGALLEVCSASEMAQQEAVAAGVLRQLLLVVQSDCTERAKRKAQKLLKVLRNSWSHESIANSRDFAASGMVPF